MKRKIIKQIQQLREVFQKFVDSITKDKNKVVECVTKFNNFEEKLATDRKNECIINDFVCQFPESAAILEIKDLQRIV